MVRIASIDDSIQLEILNNEFNGKRETNPENIRKSLSDNKQEVVVVDEQNGLLVGFVCIQLKKSFCYDEYMPELTEVYVKKEYRNKEIAISMITFAEQYCMGKYDCHTFELLTGEDNTNAQMVYNKLGYERDREIHLTKRA
ncbi:MAG: GNAT family N-acetyltransferase [Clostridiales bacterium]|nr:GNAT family N-acetyltransferase [Clostridiales bacterium]